MRRRQMLGVLGAVAGMAILPEDKLSAQQKPSTGSEALRESVTGIGGFFFRANEPKTLAQWYQDHLGVSVTPQKAGDPVWNQQAGPTSFTPFPEKTSYLGDPSKQWMINFRVRNLDRLVAQLQAAGIEVKVDAETYPYGRFARLHDPEGNGIELWQSVQAGRHDAITGWSTPSAEDMVAQLLVHGAEFWVPPAGMAIGNASPTDLGGTAVRLMLLVDDPDAVFNQAVAAGAVVRSPVQDRDYGWRDGSSGVILKASPSYGPFAGTAVTASAIAIWSR